jgi:uncharacterized protein (TIGR03085 family)
MRGAFASMLDDLGPDAPTLCEGWTTQDIAIHLVLIERHPESWLAVMIGNRIAATRPYFEGLVALERDRPWAELVERVRVGPTRGPLAHAAFRNHMMFREYTVHGEDVRRANSLPAGDFGDAVCEATWKKARSFARFVKVVDGHGLEIASSDGRIHHVRDGSPKARITGDPIELLLYEFGRGAAAHVEFSGDPDAVAAVRVNVVKAEALPRVR